MSKMETHESYGMLSFNRGTCGSRSLFGSSIQHQNIITMRLYEGAVERDLNTDFYMNKGLIAEVEMSLSQFAEAITSMNMGSGIPVTIKWLKGKGDIEPCPFTSKQEQFENEFKDNIHKTNKMANELIEMTQELLNKKTALTKSEKSDIISMLNRLYLNINNNQAFIYQQFNEQMEKTITEAKGEIECFMQNKMFSIANTALVENKNDINHQIESYECPVDITPTKNNVDQND